jgi:hypothetical protein
MTRESRAGLRGEGWDKEQMALFWNEKPGLCNEIGQKEGEIYVDSIFLCKEKMKEACDAMTLR